MKLRSAPLHSRPLPDWIVNLLASPPAAGSGVHFWIYHCACKLLPWRPVEEILKMLVEASQKCGRRVTDHELTDAVKNAQNDFVPENKSPALRLIDRQQQPRLVGAHGWPVADWTKIKAISAQGTGLYDLWEASPQRVEAGAGSRYYVDVLMQGAEFLCFAKTGPPDAVTQRRWIWNGVKKCPQGYSFMVPSPMSALTGLNKEGRESQRCLNNTGPRRWIVIEFDFAHSKPGEKAGPADEMLDAMAAEPEPRTAPDLCAAILLQLLSEGAPLALAVHSGGKSVHGWFPASGVSEPHLRALFTRCRILGCDSATWSPVQLVRIPDGTRSDGRRQMVYYHDPKFFS